MKKCRCGAIMMEVWVGTVMIGWLCIGERCRESVGVAPMPRLTA